MSETGIWLTLFAYALFAAETLPNGIRLPGQWPPRDGDPAARRPMRLPYLENPPAVIPIDVGRQLFVDDFLISKTNLRRQFHHASIEPLPILTATTELELNQGFRPGACPHSGGVWYDWRERLFKMWYMTGWYGGSGYATSTDGIHWKRPNLGLVPGANYIPDPSPRLHWGMDHVLLDLFTADPSQRFKSMHFYHASAEGEGGRVHVSSDGIHWGPPTPTGPSGDRNTFFYNPFRKKWIFSIKTQAQDASKSRARNYWEADDFVEGARWRPEDPVFWTGADDSDLPDPAIGDPPQLYDLDAVAYESLMLGIFQIHEGPDNRISDREKRPKMTELELGYTRDGFHWDRPDRTPFIGATRRKGDWRRGYIHSAGGVALIVGERLYFYFSGFSGEAPNGPDMYAGCSTGVAYLRRDGFASMDAGQGLGSLETRRLRFGGKYLFVNAAAAKGEVRAEILDEQGKVIEPFSARNSSVLKKDKTSERIVWRGAPDLSVLKGRSVRIRFWVRNASLYAFWISHGKQGHSGGYLAAGGPGFEGPRDIDSGDVVQHH